MPNKARVTPKPPVKVKRKARPVMGRPPAYKAAFCRQVIEFLGDGYSLTAFAGNIGVGRDTVYEWAKSRPDFSDAVAIARAKRTLYWEVRLNTADKDTRSVTWALRNSCAEEWADAPEVAVTVNHETRVDLTKPPEEWGLAEIEAELARRGALGAINGNGKPKETAKA